MTVDEKFPYAFPGLSKVPENQLLDLVEFVSQPVQIPSDLNIGHLRRIHGNLESDISENIWKASDEELVEQKKLGFSQPEALEWGKYLYVISNKLDDHIAALVYQLDKREALGRVIESEIQRRIRVSQFQAGALPVPSVLAYILNHPRKEYFVETTTGAQAKLIGIRGDVGWYTAWFRKEVAKLEKALGFTATSWYIHGCQIAASYPSIRTVFELGIPFGKSAAIQYVKSGTSRDFPLDGLRIIPSAEEPNEHQSESVESESTPAFA